MSTDVDYEAAWHQQRNLADKCQGQLKANDEVILSWKRKYYVLRWKKCKSNPSQCMYSN